ncbi:LysR family transcriptional regulator [Fulvimarina sp. MAC8]|uniref:LysR family transcriptional regulator n=1 Tax=Fulvimarina sp. MAC8 TaxID=3162874 RepID=UPI0032F00E6E
MLDWDDLRFFLAIARHGSLTAASQELRVAQSTVGRRLASLESSLGVRLLHRTPEGYLPTLAGDSVRAQAERVESEVQCMAREVGGLDERLEGVVRVTSSETVAVHILASCFADLQARHPDILIELVPASRELSLAMREADISVRLTRPVQHDLVVRRVGKMGYALYASVDYLQKHGDPDFRDECFDHRMMMVDDEDPRQTLWLEGLAARSSLGFRSNSHDAVHAAAVAGAGLACLACFRADPEPSLKRIETPTEAPATEIFLVVHKDNRRIPRVRAVLSAISEAMKAIDDELDCVSNP